MEVRADPRPSGLQDRLAGDPAPANLNIGGGVLDQPLGIATVHRIEGFAHKLNVPT
jgi:hypothetical protein